ncbi:hypothetical protein GCM10019016_137250 [Streptomyces prasinosporus]|uniref:Uncharacterized protein n=1 Tax=Streptomyces prasinosporus TaxID=68256 RepID=A0ABP6UHA3_9ACTN|nr:hypothetical protein GCM10010332_00190 [Streptomyces albogriseolus]
MIVFGTSPPGGQATERAVAWMLLPVRDAGIGVGRTAAPQAADGRVRLRDASHAGQEQSEPGLSALAVPWSESAARPAVWGA